jgi:Amt family ammonium transporter
MKANLVAIRLLTPSAISQYTIVLVSFIYPIVVHWGWSADGWASPWREDDLLFGCGVTDFAGSGIVHLTGAMAAFWGCFFLGPRRHRNPEQPEYGYVFQTLGTLILFFGWFGFNGCSTLYIVGYGQVSSDIHSCPI